MNPFSLIKPYLWGGAILLVLSLILAVFWLRDSLQDAKTEAATEKAAKIQAMQAITKIEQSAAKEYQNRTEYLSKLEQAEYERKRLETCIADKSCIATVRVRVPAVCPANQESNPTGIITTSAELTAEAGNAYFDLREGIEEIEAKYSLCQAMLSAWAN